jgi:hypothetical protein
MDETPGSLDALLELAARDEASGIGDAPWPPHFAKAEGEAKRVAPSRAKKAAKPFADQLGEGFGAKRFRKRANNSNELGAPFVAASSPRVGSEESSVTADPAPTKAPRRRTPKAPLLTIAQSPDKSAAESGLARWKEKHPVAAAHLAPDDVLTDRMRGASTIWYRIRVNLRNVPEDQRPMEQTPDPDDDPTRAWREQNSVPTNGRTT